MNESVHDAVAAIVRLEQHRPGTIADVISIDLPRPRDLSVINTERFGRYAAKLRSLLDAQGGMF